MSCCERGLISPEVEELADLVERGPSTSRVIQALFDETSATTVSGFKEALLDARDQLGLALAETWRRLSPDYLNYDDVAAMLLGVDAS